MEYIVQPGDTLFKIARRFGISLEELIAANPQISDPSKLLVGQRIIVPTEIPPTPTIYIVRPGDTLYLIARRYGITLEELIRANPQISDPNQINVGDRINIPKPSDVISYIVQRGDTLFLIARRFGTTVETLLRLNPSITDPNLIFPGQSILVPAVGPKGCVVYVSTRTGRPELWRSDGLGRGQVQLTRFSGTPEEPVSNPQWSPDGRYITYQAVGGLFVIDPCGRRPFLVAEDVAPLSYSWSNDSTMIAYSTADGTLYITDLQGRAREILTNFHRPVWFSDNRRIAGFTEREGAFPVLATVDITGENFTIYEDIAATLIKLSPDSRYAAVQYFRGAPYMILSVIQIYDFVTGNVVLLPGFKFEEPVDSLPPREVDFSILGGWAPDSSKLVYSTIKASDGTGEIRIASPQGQVIQSFPVSFYPETKWGPLSNWIIYTASDTPGTLVYRPTVPRKIYIRSLSTGQQSLIASEGDNYTPDWNIAECPLC